MLNTNNLDTNVIVIQPQFKEDLKKWIKSALKEVEAPSGRSIEAELRRTAFKAGRQLRADKCEKIAEVFVEELQEGKSFVSAGLPADC